MFYEGYPRAAAERPPARHLDGNELGGHSVTRRGVRRIAGAMVSIGVVLMAAEGWAPGTRMMVAVQTASPAACGAAAPGMARCLALFMHTPARPADAGGGPAGLTPTDIRSAYGLPAIGARGRTVAVVDAYDDPNAEADLGVYRATFGLPPCTVATGCFRKADQRGGPSYPAASPLVTAVGGTSLSRANTPRGWAETAWSGSGYGCSSVEAKPAWQGATGCSGRSIADVAAVADPRTGVAVYNSYRSQGWTVAGGTSAAAPIIASIYALVGNTRDLVGASRAYAAVGALHDVAQSGGGSGLLGGILGSSGSAASGPGYHGPTGLGSPAGTNAF